MIIKGRDLSTSIKEALKVRVEVLKTEYGRTPNLVVILVGEDPGSVSYVTGKAKAANEVGIAIILYVLRIQYPRQSFWPW